MNLFFMIIVYELAFALFTFVTFLIRFPVMFRTSAVNTFDALTVPQFFPFGFATCLVWV